MHARKRSTRTEHAVVMKFEDRPAPGFTKFSELMNGRAAMVGFMAVLIIELATGEGLVPKFLELLGQ